jgi:hypothetical protein
MISTPAAKSSEIFSLEGRTIALEAAVDLPGKVFINAARLLKDTHPMGEKL